MDDPIGRWLIEIFLLVLSAVVSAAQSALDHVNDAKLEESDAPNAEKLLKLTEDPNDTFLALRGLKLFLMLLAASLGTVFFLKDRSQGPLTALIVCFVFAILMMALCKLVPERLGKRRAEATALALFPLIRGARFLFSPLVMLQKGIARLVLSLFGVDMRQTEEEVTQEEIQDMLDIGEESGVIESDEHEMIKNVFDFGDLTAADCMTHRTHVKALWINDDKQTILDTIRESGLSRFPVYREDIDDVIGVLATRDYLLNLDSETPKPLRDLLRSPYFVPETVPTDVLLRNMQKVKTHLAIVVDEYGGVSGIVTMEDLLEEIVGNIYDEFDPASESEIQPLGENTWRVSGTAELENLAEEMHAELPQDEDYDTLGGLVFSRFNTIPEDGSTPEITLYCTEDGEKPEDEEQAQNTARIRIEVERIEDRRVAWAKVTYLPPEKKRQGDEENKK